MKVRDQVLVDGWIQSEVEGISILLKPMNIDNLDLKSLAGKLVVRRHTPDFIASNCSPFNVRKPSEEHRKTAHFGCPDASTASNDYPTEAPSVQEVPAARTARKTPVRRVLPPAKKKEVMAKRAPVQPKTHH